MNAGRTWILVAAAGAATAGLVVTASADGTGSAAAGSGGTVEPVFQNGKQVDRDGIPELAFAIDRVYEHEQPTAAPPYHVAGGTWTYFDAHVAADPAATFTIGMPALAGGDEPAFGKAMLVPTTAAAGARVVRRFAAAFGVAVPPSAPGRLAPMKIDMSVLGTGIGDQGNGYGGSGTWNATKWFLATEDKDDIEIFFNYSLAEKKAVLSEKDSDYDADVAGVLAIALRDGRPAPRSSANDPTLAARPAELVLGRPIPGHHVEAIGNTVDHALVEIDDRGHSALAQLELATGAIKELYRTRHSLDLGVCARAAPRCVVRVVTPHRAGERRASDRSRLLLVDGTRVTPLAIPTTDLGELAISDDGRILVTCDGRLVAWDLTSKRQLATRKIADDGKSLTHAIGWRARAVIVAYEPFAEGTKPTYSLWHLDTGKEEPIATPDEALGPVAPDGSRRIDFASGKAIVTPLPAGTPRTLALYQRDYEALAGGYTQWLDSRYVAVPGRRYWAVLDTDTMKVSLLAGPADDDDRRIDVLRGSGHVIVTTADGSFLATVKP